MFLPLVLWSGLSLVFLWRLKVILLNFRCLVRPGPRWYHFPRVSLRPLYQLLIWNLELAALAFLYQVLGTAVLAHLTASVVACGIMFLLRETREPSFLRSVQILPLKVPVADTPGARAA